MKTTRLYLIGWLVILIFAFSPQSFAQPLMDFYSSPGYSAMIDNMISNSIWNSAMQRYTKNYPGQQTGGSGSSAAKYTIRRLPRIVPAYRQYPAVRFKSTGTRLMLQKLADDFGKTPEDKADWKKLISDILDKFDAAARVEALPNDVTLAYVSYVGLNKLIYHQITDEPILPFEMNIGLRDAVAEFATDHQLFKDYSNREKQELYEVLIIYGAVAYHLYEKALKEKNTEQIKKAKILAAQNLEFARIKP